MALLALAVLLPAAADAQEMPKILADLHKDKASWRVDVLEGPNAPGGRPTRMIVCADQVVQQPVPVPGGCATRILRDTADEAVVETECQGQKGTMSITREAPATLLVAIAGRGFSAKARYTRLGPCAPGQPAMAVE